MQNKPTTLKILDIVSILVLGISTYLALFYAQTELVMGEVQRVFYFHVATAWVAMLGFIAAIIPSIIYLINQDHKWDRMEVAAIEISLVFFLITIVLGSIWGRIAWGTWWDWEPRLTTAAITELIYIAYFMLRQGIDDPNRRARFGAVYTIIASISVPITFMSIRWAQARTIHPVVIGAANANQDKLPLSPEMKVAFFFALFAFTIIFSDLFWNRIRLGSLEDNVEQLKLKVTI